VFFHLFRNGGGGDDFRLVAEAAEPTVKLRADGNFRRDGEMTVAVGDDESILTEEHDAYCNDEKAVIRDDPDIVTWRIEESSLDVELAIRVKGGLVQAVYANADIYPEVYDLDVSDFPDDGEAEEAADREAELVRVFTQPGWRVVW